MTKRKRRLKSIADELVIKSQEAALAAVQIYNNPAMTFKAELFIVIMNIAWTYLLHAYYRKKSIDYRYAKGGSGKKKRFATTKHGAHKYWELEQCLSHNQCPVDDVAKENIRFLIGIRHEIEHQMTQRLDSNLSAKFQANCLNFNALIKKLFGEKYSIDRHLSFSLQFSSISPTQTDQLLDQEDLPSNILSFISDFEGQLSDDNFADARYAYRVFFVPKVVNKKGQADRVIEFIKVNDPMANAANAEYEKVFLKEVDRLKYMVKDIVKAMNDEGFKKFKTLHHTNLWKDLDAKNPAKGYTGKLGEQWYWYESWFKVVRAHCEENAAKYQ